MAKIACAGGHSKKCPGARCYIDEYTQDRKVNKALLAELNKRGHTVYDCSNEAATQNAELAAEVYAANKSGAKLFCATHFNACSKTSGKRGVEVWYYTGTAMGKKIAEKMSKDLAALFGLPNRGAKATKNLYVLANTSMCAILPEVCFVDAKGDVEGYQDVTAAQIAAVMADAIEYGVGTVKKQATTFTPYVVRITKKTLPVRKTASSTAVVVTNVKQGDAFTIVGTKTVNGVKWGQLKSKSGWINLNYAKRI